MYSMRERTNTSQQSANAVFSSTYSTTLAVHPPCSSQLPGDETGQGESEAAKIIYKCCPTHKSSEDKDVHADARAQKNNSDARAQFSQEGKQLCVFYSITACQLPYYVHKIILCVYCLQTALRCLNAKHCLTVSSRLFPAM